MAELPALRSLLPERVAAAPPELFGRTHSYGVARELELMRRGFALAPRAPRLPVRRRRPPGRLLRWWVTTDLRPVAEVWHRFRCRTGHHDLGGGYRLRCVRCDAEPPL
jgi:hypothetical protein